MMRRPPGARLLVGRAGGVGRRRRPRGRRCWSWLTSPPWTPPARPGRARRGCTGRPTARRVELTPAAARRLACDATLRMVVTDGADILGVTAAHPKVSATLRAALTVRDGGCRFPTCQHPAELCDNHHLVPVTDNGPTCLANLALICRDHHHAIHDSNWHVTLRPDASMTFTRRGVTVTSHPRSGQHPRPADPPPTGRPPRHHPTHPGHPPDPGPRADRPRHRHQITRRCRTRPNCCPSNHPPTDRTCTGPAPRGRPMHRRA